MRQFTILIAEISKESLRGNQNNDEGIHTKKYYLLSILFFRGTILAVIL